MAGVATGQLVSLSFLASSDETEGFTHLAVFRSRTGEDGPYEEITGEAWSLPRHTVLAKSAVLNGRDLELRVNEKHDVVVTFSGTDPISAASAATQVQAQSAGLLQASVEGDYLLIEALSAGSASTLRVVGGDAATLLELPSIEPDSIVFGKDARIPLLPDVESYDFTDPHGDASYYYRYRFINSTLNQVSAFSDPVSAASLPVVATGYLIVGYLTAVDIHGRAVADLEVKVRLKSATTLLGGVLVVGSQSTVRTDSSGRAEFYLPRGAEVTVVLTGTTIARDVTVPSDPDLASFNLLDAAYGTDDAFKVQVPDLEFANRRSL